MSEKPTEPAEPPTQLARALSFDAVAAAYHRARPGYPDEAARWLLGAPAGPVLELGAGTGKLTGALRAAGGTVLASDPLASMLAHLRRDLPGVPTVVAAAESIPLRTGSVDLVVSGQAFHWFDLDRALPEIARVLAPGGRLALTWNLRDERVPWVRRLGRLLNVGAPEQSNGPTEDLLASQLFGFVRQETFRFWQPLGRATLRDLALSRSNLAVMEPGRREELLAQVDALYDDYGRGPDGMLMPYLTHCFVATVRPRSRPTLDPPRPATDPAQPSGTGGTGGLDGTGGPGEPPPDDAGSLLIDFR